MLYLFHCKAAWSDFITNFMYVPLLNDCYSKNMYNINIHSSSFPITQKETMNIHVTKEICHERVPHFFASLKFALEVEAGMIVLQF